MIGKTLGHYQILALLGRGGMGEVYRAHDTRLKRDVALKVLPADTATHPERLERFQREAETVAALNHPHIVTLHSVEEAGGVRFLTMELVEGQTLDSLIPAGGLPLAQVFEIGMAVSDALAAAHDRGIVHRDLKPANVMVAKDGRIKVLDFGLAKLSQEPPSDPGVTLTSPITLEGAVMGTVPYMSPEQVRGQAADHRSDIFSLGIMLHEMATGERPFKGDTNPDVTSSILRDTPRPLDEIRPDLPHQLARIVSQCLEKSPRDRYHSAMDVRNDLRVLRREVESGVSHERAPARLPGGASSAAPQPGRRMLWIGIASLAIVGLAVAAFWKKGGPERAPSAGDAPSIAVLPFANMSGDPGQDYFSDGISEELLNLLAQIPALKVAARTSSFSFKGQNVEIPEIGRRLNVSHVLEGSVRKSGERVRITAQLIQASDGYHVWSQTYDRTFSDIFAIQDEIAADVVELLQVALVDQAAPTARKTTPEAYGLYLQAIQLVRQSNEESLRAAESALHKAVELDPNYAPAWDALCNTYISQLYLGAISNADGLARVRETAERTVRVDPDYAPGYARLAWHEIYANNDFAAGAGQLERALAIDPADPRALSACSALLENLGRLDEAMAVERALAERDPLSPTRHYALGITQRRLRQFDAALASFATTLALSPQRGGVHYQMSMTQLLKGDAPKALAEIEQEQDDVWRLIGRPPILHALGRKADAAAAFDSLTTAFAKDGPSNIAADYALCGDRDRAFAWLEKAIEYKDPGVYEVFDNMFANLHDDPRWLPFLRKIDRAPEQLEKIKFEVKLPAS